MVALKAFAPSLPRALERPWDGRRLKQASQDLVSWEKRVGYQPALGLQFAAYGSQGEEGWGAVCGDKLLPEKLHVEAKVQCSGQAVRICIYLPDDLQVRRWMVRNGLWRVQPYSRGEGCWFMDKKDRQKRKIKTEVRGLPPNPISPNLANPDLPLN